jgi:hypothetical protein
VATFDESEGLVICAVPIPVPVELVELVMLRVVVFPAISTSRDLLSKKFHRKREKRKKRTLTKRRHGIIRLRIWVANIKSSGDGNDILL